MIQVEYPVDGGRAVLRFTEVTDGDFAIWSDDVDARRAAFDARPWTWLREQHGAAVVTVGHPGDGAGSLADASVTACPGAVLAIQVADCAPVGLWSPSGVVAAVHAGWRGLVAGVIPAAVERMRALGATAISAVLGPCIRVGRYEFGTDDLARAADVLGDAVRGTTDDGAPALDMVAAVRSSVASAGIDDLTDVGRCTARSGDLWSWRADRTRCRHALVVVREAA
jgi:copper oxidase (laccase) domain-containing protein